MVDRYRLFGRHFQGRASQPAKDPFIGFDWVHPDGASSFCEHDQAASALTPAAVYIVQVARREEEDGNLKYLKDTAGPAPDVKLQDDQTQAKRSAQIVAAAAAALQ